jgi:hypothetical protein
MLGFRVMALLSVLEFCTFVQIIRSSQQKSSVQKKAPPHVRAEAAKWKPVLKEANIMVQ